MLKRVLYSGAWPIRWIVVAVAAQPLVVHGWMDLLTALWFSHEGPTTSNGQCLTSVPPLLASSQHICLRGERGSPQFINPLANNERNKRISAGGFSNLVNFFTSSPSYWFLLVPYGVVHRVVFFDATFGVCRYLSLNIPIFQYSRSSYFFTIQLRKVYFYVLGTVHRLRTLRLSFRQ